MKRICLVIVLALLFAACGKKQERKIGGNNQNVASNNETDVGMTTGVDMGDDDDASTPPDMPRDMIAEDTGTDSGGDMAPDQGRDAGADMAPDMDTCPDENRDNGQPCDCDDQCSGRVCLDADPQSGDEGFCSITCTTRDDCNQGNGVCMFDSSGRDVCRPDDTGQACTANDTFDPGACSQACLQAGSNHAPRHYCSVPCEDSADCKTGHACSPTRCRQGADGLSCVPTIVAFRAGANKPTVLDNYPLDFNLCVPIGEDNPCDLASDEFACASGICDDNQTRCSGQCLTTDDCPAGGCTDIDVSDPDVPIRFCNL